MKTVTAFNTDGTVTKLLCREDEHGNLWVVKCPDNRRALGLDPNSNEPKAHFGGCFVPDNGNEREARENSLRYYTGEGKNFVVGENPNAATASKLSSLLSRVLVDAVLASRVEEAIKEHGFVDDYEQHH